MNFEQAKEKAVKYLVLTLRTENEVRNKLKRLNVEEDIIEEVINYLKGINYINDSNYIEAYIRQCSKIPKYSKYEIKMKLLQKGIDKSFLEEKLEKYDMQEYERKIIEKLKESKLKDMDQIKQKAYLYRRGFNVIN